MRLGASQILEGLNHVLCCLFGGWLVSTSLGFVLYPYLLSPNAGLYSFFFCISLEKNIKVYLKPGVYKR